MLGLSTHCKDFINGGPSQNKCLRTVKILLKNWVFEEFEIRKLHELNVVNGHFDKVTCIKSHKWQNKQIWHMKFCNSYEKCLRHLIYVTYYVCENLYA